MNYSAKLKCLSICLLLLLVTSEAISISRSSLLRQSIHKKILQRRHESMKNWAKRMKQRFKIIEDKLKLDGNCGDYDESKIKSISMEHMKSKLHKLLHDIAKFEKSDEEQLMKEERDIKKLVAKDSCALAAEIALLRKNVRKIQRIIKKFQPALINKARKEILRLEHLHDSSPSKLDDLYIAKFLEGKTAKIGRRRLLFLPFIVAAIVSVVGAGTIVAEVIEVIEVAEVVTYEATSVFRCGDYTTCDSCTQHHNPIGSCRWCELSNSCYNVGSSSNPCGYFQEITDSTYCTCSPPSSRPIRGFGKEVCSWYTQTSGSSNPSDWSGGDFLPSNYASSAKCACSGCGENGVCDSIYEQEPAAASCVRTSLIKQHKALDSTTRQKVKEDSRFSHVNLFYQMHKRAYKECHCAGTPAPFIAWEGVFGIGGIMNCQEIISAVYETGRCGCGW